MQLIKQIAGELAKPLAIATLIGLVACAVRLRGWRRVANWLAGVGIAVSFLSALVPVGEALLGPLERQYPPVNVDRALPVVRYIVVLGAGYRPWHEIPVTAALDADALDRIVEGVRLQKKLSGARLICSGGAPPGQAPSAIGCARLAGDLGVPSASIILSAEALDTAAEARAVARLIGSAPFLLVTTASHMPRAMLLMERAGARPIAAPTGQRVQGMSHDWLPNSVGLNATERAIHEYVGLVAIHAGLD